MTPLRIPAADELHTLIDTVVVTWDAEERIHWLEVQGKLLEWLSVMDIKKAATLSGAACSLELVAGAGFGLWRTVLQIRR